MDTAPSIVEGLLSQAPTVVVMLILFSWIRTDLKEFLAQRNAAAKETRDAYFALVNRTLTMLEKQIDPSKDAIQIGSRYAPLTPAT